MHAPLFRFALGMPQHTIARHLPPGVGVFHTSNNNPEASDLVAQDHDAVQQVG